MKKLFLIFLLGYAKFSFAGGPQQNMIKKDELQKKNQYAQQYKDQKKIFVVKNREELEACINSFNKKVQ